MKNLNHQPRPLTKKDWAACAIDKPGRIALRCATCGDDVAWGSHPLCARDGRGRLMAWPETDLEKRFRAALAAGMDARLAAAAARATR